MIRRSFKFPCRRRAPTTRFALLFLAMAPNLAWGQVDASKQVEQLTAQGRELQQRRDFSGAETLFKRALTIREKELGPDHPDVAVILNSLALLYHDHGQAAEGEPLAKRALAILEKARGRDHADVATILNNLAEIDRSQGRLADAERLEMRALAIREKNFGPDHPDVAVILNDLAMIYRAQARYSDAEPLLKRALAIREKSPLASASDVVESLNNLANLYFVQSRLAEAEPFLERALAIREKTFGPDHPDVAESLEYLAILQKNQGRVKDAEPLFKRALAIHEKTLGPDHVDVGGRLSLLGMMYLNQARYAEAESLLKRVLAIYEKALGRDHIDVAGRLNNLGVLYQIQGRYAEAEPLLKRALAIKEKAAGLDDPDVAISLNNLVLLYGDQGRYAEAEALSKRALAIYEKAWGHDHPDVAVALNNLAMLYRVQGRYDEAEQLYKRAIPMIEKAHGREDRVVASLFNNLALLYEDQHRHADAEHLYRRALAITEKADGPDHPDVATTLNNLAALDRLLNRRTEAEQLYIRALAILEKSLGADHPTYATSLNNLALLNEDQGHVAEAEALLKRVLAIREKTLGSDHPDNAVSLNNLAVLYYHTGRYAEAEPLYKSALAIKEKSFGRDNPDLASVIGNLATLYRKIGRLDEALNMSRRAVELRVAQIDRGANNQRERGAAEQKGARDNFILLISILKQSTSASNPTPEVVEEAFRAAQYAGGVETARALADMTARFAAGSGALAKLVRERQDMSVRWRALDGALIKAVSQSPDKRNAESETALRTELVGIDSKLLVADAELRRNFPRFAELGSAKPVILVDVQKTLASGEALVAWTVGDDETYVFVIRKDRATFFAAPLKREELTGVVASLRDALDRRGRLPVEMPPFDTAKAYSLYQRLLAPAEPLLAGATSLIIVADGAMQSLPPSVLVTEAPQPPITGAADYKSVHWLVRRYALTVLPAVSSLTSLRRFAETRHASKPFIGFGDPDFGGGKLESDKTKSGKTESAQAQAAIQPVSLFRGATANIDQLRHLPPLPETASELHAEAKALGASPSSVYLRKDATVTKVKSLDLGDVRVIAFATHGLVAGELPKLAEPALALTPPLAPTKDDDGLLRASDVSQLKFNADWVVLSACNTAAADGASGAEALSGLAKAFFYAGARSLLVSHWPVDSAATVILTTSAFNSLKKNPAIGRAEAFRRAMLEMIDKANKSNEAHPLYWAPFVVVGEGGNGK